MNIIWVTITPVNKWLGNSELAGMSKALHKQGYNVFTVLMGESDDKNIIGIKKSLNKLTLYRLKVLLYLPLVILKLKPKYVIYDYHSAVTSLLVLFVRLFLKFKVVMDIRSVPVESPSKKALLDFKLNILVAKYLFNGITAINELTKKKVVSDFNLQVDTIGIWNSGVDEGFLNPIKNNLKTEIGLQNKFVIFYHGYLSENRGVRELLESIIILKQTIKNIHFLILGDGPYKETLISLVKKEKLTNNVSFKELVPYDQVPNYISLADICVSPLPDLLWWRISSPLKVLEYMALAKPMVLTNIAAHRQYISLNSSVFIDDIEPVNIAQGVLNVYSRYKEYSTKAIDYPKIVKTKFTWDIQATALLKYLQRV